MGVIRKNSSQKYMNKKPDQWKII